MNERQLNLYYKTLREKVSELSAQAAAIGYAAAEGSPEDDRARVLTAMANVLYKEELRVLDELMA